MRRLVTFTILVLLTLAALALLYEFRVAVIMFLLSLVVAAFFRPPVRRLQAAGLPKVLSILIVYVVGLGILGGLLFLGLSGLFRDLQELTDVFAINYVRFIDQAGGGSEFQQMLASQLPPIESLYDAIAGEQGMMLANAVLGFASGLAEMLSRLLIVVVVSIYWSIDESHFERLWLSLLSANRRIRAREIWRGIETGVGSYLRSEIIQSLLAGVLLSLLFWWLGLPYPTLLAILAALAWLIPWLGAVLAVVPAFLAGYFTSPLLGFAAAGVTLLVLVFLEVVVEPRLFNRKQYSSILIVLMVIALADEYGLLGIMLGPPLGAAIQILATHLLSQPSSRPLPPQQQVKMLKDRMLGLREQAEEFLAAEPQIESWLSRLDRLLERTEEELSQSAAQAAVAGTRSPRIK
jgi:predicted PurR-regulated permease PerM